MRLQLHSAACRLLQNEMEADDAVQDAVVNLMTARDATDSKETRFRLFAILKNVCIDKLRRRKHTVDISECATMAIEPDYDEVDRTRQLLLSALPPLQRRIFELSTFEDMDYSEIATKLDMSIDAVRMNMSRARRTLRQKYKQLQL
ncbi:MAG: RNA polymerase sigma factor [Muribaculaceae bacterium]